METFPVVVISGARQVEKSTLIKHAFPTDTDCVVFDPVVDVENARHDPDLFLNNHPANLFCYEFAELCPAI